MRELALHILGIIENSTDHIDLPLLGDLSGTMTGLLAVNPGIDFIYWHRFNEREFIFQTSEIKQELDGVEIDRPVVLEWIEGYLEESLEALYREG